MSAAPGNASRLAVIAVGGNALIVDDDHQQIFDQSVAAEQAAHQITRFVQSGWRVILTHGNAPQVGFILRRSEIALGEVPSVPMDYAGADTQGAIGYMFQRAIGNDLERLGMPRHVATVVTQVLVERDDPAFHDPVKPVGAHMGESQALAMARERGWVVRDEPGRGWRRVVASPHPRAIVDLDAVRCLSEAGYVVIACGGGGIPVVRNDRRDLVGIEAVIDKDLSSALLARELGADALIITTEVEKVALDFGKPDQRWLDQLSLTQARRYLAEGHFPPGSMGPKVSALVDFVAGGGELGLITNPANLARAMAGQTGTRIVFD